MKLSVLLAVPAKYQEDLDLETVVKVFPYGKAEFIIQDGGMVAQSGAVLGMMLFGFCEV